MSDESMVLVGVEVFGALGGSLGHVAGRDGGVLEVDCLALRGSRLQIPLEWVAEVGESVHLCKTCRQAMEESPWGRRPVAGRVTPPGTRAGTTRPEAFLPRGDQ